MTRGAEDAHNHASMRFRITGTVVWQATPGNTRRKTATDPQPGAA
jgi:predicted component of type VI protein secretion system